MRITDAIEFIYSKKEVKLKELAESLDLTVNDTKQFVKTLQSYKFLEYDEEDDAIKLTELVEKTMKEDSRF